VLHLPIPTATGGTARAAPGADVGAALRRFLRDEIVGGVECARCGLAATVAAADAAGAERQTDQRQDPNQQQQQQPFDLPLLRDLSMRAGPLPPFDLQRAAAAAGLAWRPTRRTVAKCSRLVRAPPALALHLQRTVHNAAGGAVKLHGHVTFPLELDLGPFLANAARAVSGSSRGSSSGVGTGAQDCGSSSSSSSSSSYHLVAVGQHLGLGSSSGHYVVYRRLKGTSSGSINSGDAAAASAGASRSAADEETAAAEPAPAPATGLAAILPPSPPAAPAARHKTPGAGVRLGASAPPVPAAGLALASGFDSSFSWPGQRQRQQLTSGSSGADASARAAQGDGGAHWVRISDASVSRVAVQEVLGCEATLVLYERRCGADEAPGL